MKAISVEGGDLHAREKFPPAVVPYIGGYQRAGVVEAVGSDVKGLKVGQRVAAFNWNGAYAELSAVPASFVYPIPDGVDFKEAIAVPVAFGTAAEALLTNGQLKSGETVLITGAAGGVGLAAIQIAKSVGATVIGVTAPDEHLGRLKKYGMDYGINYMTEDVGKRCQEITEGKGVDLVLDLIGGASIASSVEAVSIGGRISVVGFISDPSGENSNYNVLSLITKKLTAIGTFFGTDMHSARAHEMIEGLMNKVAEGEFSMPIEKEFTLENGADAHRYIENNRPLFGRIVMIP